MTFNSVGKKTLIKQYRLDDCLNLMENTFSIETFFKEERTLYITLKNVEKGYFYKTSFPLEESYCIDLEEMCLYTVENSLSNEIKNSFFQELRSFYTIKYKEYLRETERLFFIKENLNSKVRYKK